MMEEEIVAAQQPAQAHPNIVVDIGLDRSLAAQLDSSAPHVAIGQDLDALLRILGVPGQSQVQLRTSGQTARSRAPVLFLSVDGQLTSSPWELLVRVYYYVTGNAPDEAFTPGGLLSALGRLSATQLATFVRLASVEIIKRTPAILLTPDSASAYWSALGCGLGDFDFPGARWLQGVLSPVLSLRISIADRATVAQVLQTGMSEARSPAAIAEELIAALRSQVVEIQLGQDYLRQLTLNIPANEHSHFALMRDGLFYELGVRFPTFAFVQVEDLQPDSFQFKINHLTTAPTRGLRIDECLVNDTPDRLGLLRIEGRTALNPANLIQSAIMSAKDKVLAEQAGLTTWSQLGYLILTMSAALSAYASCFLDRAEVEAQLEKLEVAFPELVKANRDHLSSEVLVQTLRQLLSEQISIRNLREILQVMIDLDHDGSPYTVFDPEAETSRRPERDWFEDPINLASLVRMRMSRYIAGKCQRGTALVVYLLDRKIETLLANRQMMPVRQYMAQIEPFDKDRIMTALHTELDPLLPTAQYPVVLTTSGVRPIFRELIAPEFPKVAVLSYHEVAPDMNIQPIARISWS
jgi:flagellar biosynthesis component FlhA